LFGSVDNSVNHRNQELELKIKDGDRPILKEEDETPEYEETMVKETPTLFEEEVVSSRTVEFIVEKQEGNLSDDDSFDDEGGLFGEDDEDEDFKVGKAISEDQVINEDGLMEIRKTKERLEQQAKERRDKLKKGKVQEMTKDEFKQKWEAPAYLRRGVKMDNVPHSSESNISRYSLNDDNSILGNNKFLHDNVD
jgi:cell division protein FtsZ